MAKDARGGGGGKHELSILDSFFTTSNVTTSAYICIVDFLSWVLEMMSHAMRYIVCKNVCWLVLTIVSTGSDEDLKTRELVQQTMY